MTFYKDPPDPQWYGGLYNPKTRSYDMEELKITPKEIQAMIDAGWTMNNEGIMHHKEGMFATCSWDSDRDLEYIVFARPKLKPNAHVDFERLERELDSIKSYGSAFSEPIQACIKKIEP